MNLRPLTEFKKTLAFQLEPMKSWPMALLPVAWQGELLCGFNATTTFAWELDPTTEPSLIAQNFLELHPELSMLDFLKLKNQSKEISWGQAFFIEVAKQASKGQETQWLKLFENLNSLPQDLLGQWQQKRLQWGDLRPLLSLEKTHIENPVWSLLGSMNFSKSEWTQVIEWCTDLLLMAKDLKTLESLKTPREVLLKLKELRYPETTAKDLLAQEFWKKLPWPKNTQAEFRRQGDQTKAYVSLNIGSMKDLKKLADELNQMAQKQ